MINILDHKITEPINNQVDKCKLSEPNLSIHLLGEFKIILNGEIIKIKRKSCRQLLHLLLAHRGKKLQRDFLLDAIFPNGNIDSIYNHFYVTLSILRKSLEPHLKSGRESQYIIQLDNHYFFNLNHVFIDVVEFEKLLNINDTLPVDLQILNLLKAESIYCGAFLEEYLYETYLEKERIRLHSRYIRILRTLAHYYWDNHNHIAGIDYFEKILSADPYLDEIYIEYIKRLLESNLLLQAINVAKRNIHFIEKEIGVNVRTNLNTLFMPFSISI